MTEAEAKTDRNQFLTFELHGESFAVDVLKAREIQDVTRVTRVPQTPEFMLGVINLRGSVVPVVDLRLKFGLQAAERTKETCIIVLEVEMEGEVTFVGALVDSVQEVLELDQSQIEPPPRMGTRLKADYIEAMANRGDEHFLIVLDIDKVFATDELVLIQEAAEQPESE